MLPSKRLSWALLAGSLCIAFCALAYPMFVIRPFRSQAPGELAAALVVRNWGPYVAAAAAVIAMSAMVHVWRSTPRWLPRMVASTGAVLSVAFAALSNVNVYEMMFHPIDSPQSMAAAEAKLDADDMVLAVRAGGESKAYPVRMMGYHHVVNDWVGGVPLVATY